MSLSVLILAKNEEKNIADCINSASFADEIVVIDDNSTDDTARIAASLGAKVYQHAMNGDWGAQQNFALDKATSDWIFFLDADERITPALAEEIKSAVAKKELYAYKVPRLNYIAGQQLRHGGWYPDYGYHLVPREGLRVEGLVHPQFVHNYPTRKLHSPLIHYPYPTWEHYFNKFNLYTKLAAEKNLQKGKKAYFIRDIVLRPHFAFFRMYILRSGWRDGRMGFIQAVFHYFYTMAKYVKLYYLQREAEEKR